MLDIALHFLWMFDLQNSKKVHTSYNTDSYMHSVLAIATVFIL